jgi:hypothetical protein
MQCYSNAYLLVQMMLIHLSHQQPPHTENNGSCTRANTHQPLQCAELDRLQSFPKRRSLLLDSCLCLLDLEFLTVRLLANSALLKIQV